LGVAQLSQKANLKIGDGIVMAKLLIGFPNLLLLQKDKLVEIFEFGYPFFTQLIPNDLKVILFLNVYKPFHCYNGDNG